MPVWEAAARSYEVPRDIALLDTDVLISYINLQDTYHANTLAVLDMAEFRWGVTHANIIEAWNFLVGREKRRDLAIALLDWVLTPGQVVLVGDAIEPVATAHTYSQKFRVDIVDAGLLDTADRISRHCMIRPAVHVATYDAADFLRLFGKAGLKFNVYDMREPYSTAETT